MTPDWSQSDPAAVLQSKPYFYILKYSSSDALPAPEFFFKLIKVISDM